MYKSYDLYEFSVEEEAAVVHIIFNHTFPLNWLKVI